MKFTVIARIANKMTGVELDDEYDRLGFDEIYRPARFPAKQITVEVDKEFARKHADQFEGETATILIDSLATDPSDWENWGSAGHMLSPAKWTPEKVERFM
jgi:hypothetical protein